MVCEGGIGGNREIELEEKGWTEDLSGLDDQNDGLLLASLLATTFQPKLIQPTNGCERLRADVECSTPDSFRFLNSNKILSLLQISTKSFQKLAGNTVIATAGGAMDSTVRSTVQHSISSTCSELSTVCNILYCISRYATRFTTRLRAAVCTLKRK